jgi:hypothetical protein
MSIALELAAANIDQYCSEQTAQEASNELRRLEALNAELLEALEDAIEDIEMWSGFASEYLKGKYGLAASIAAKRALIAKATGETK